MNYKSNTYRILAFSLAFLMFFTSAGFSIDMHFCQGDFKSFSLIGKAKNCHELAQTSTCKHHKVSIQEEEEEDCDKTEKKDCCENRTATLDSDQDQQIQTIDFTLTKEVKQFVTAYIYAFYQDKLTKKEVIPFALYRPPLIKRDIPVLIQSFLL